MGVCCIKKRPPQLIRSSNLLLFMLNPLSFIIKISNKVIQQILIQSRAFGLFQLYADRVAANFIIVDRVIIGSDG